VRGYLAKKRRPGQITTVGQADLAARCGWEVGRQSSTVGVEDKVCGNRYGNVCARVGGRGPRRRNTIWVHGAADRVRRLWPAPEDIDAVLSFKRSHPDQQHDRQEQHQLFHGSSSWPRRAFVLTANCSYWAMPIGPPIASNQ